MAAFKFAMACAMVGAIGLATPAHAGWRFTQWGMTADEVVAASEGQVGPRDPEIVAQERAEAARGASTTPDPTDRCTHKLLEPVTVSGVVFEDVRFCFSTGRLTLVVQHSKDSAALAAKAIEASLGPPVVALPRPDVQIWVFADRDKDNRLVVTLPQASERSRYRSVVRYSPIPPGL